MLKCSCSLLPVKAIKSLVGADHLPTACSTSIKLFRLKDAQSPGSIEPPHMSGDVMRTSLGDLVRVLSFSMSKIFPSGADCSEPGDRRSRSPHLGRRLGRDLPIDPEALVNLREHRERG